MTATSRTDGSFCPVYDAIQLLQEKWTLHAVRALLGGPLGFNELGRAVGGVNPATLAARLAHLEEAGIVTRTVVSFMPPRTSYALTEAGVHLHGVIDAIDAWSRTWLAPAPARRTSACSVAHTAAVAAPASLRGEVAVSGPPRG